MLPASKLFLSIILIGLIIRVWNLDLPLLEFYPTRQVQTAEITQNLLKDNFNFLYPRVDYFGPQNIYYLYEFPGYNLIVAGVHKLLGNVNDINGRKVSILSYLIATIFLYKIASGLFNKQICLIAIFFFSLFPLNVLTSRSFQPDEMMLASSLGTLYFLILWSKKGALRFLAFSSLLFAWAILIKVVAVVFLFLPVTYLLYFGNTKKKVSLTLSYLAASLLPSILWYLHAFEVSTRLNTASSTAFNLFIWFGPQNLVNPKYYLTMFGFEYTSGLLPLGMVLFLIGLMSKLRKKQVLVYWWLGGIVLYFLFFNKHSMTHEYYHLPLLPIASIFIGIGAKKIIDSLNGLAISKNLFLVSCFLLLMVLMLPPTLSRAYKPIERFATVPEAGEALARVSDPEDLVIGIMDSGPTLIYYSDRVGWHFGLDRERQLDEEKFYTGKRKQISSPIVDLDNYVKQGAKYLAIANVDQFNNSQSFKEYVISNYKLISGPDKYLIFDLAN